MPNLLAKELSIVGRMQSHTTVEFQCQGSEDERISRNLCANVHVLLRYCASLEVLCKLRIEKFAERARAYYICTYYHLDQQQQQIDTDVTASNSDASAPKKQELLPYSLIERIRKAFKGHRCALDFDNGFVNSQFVEVVDEDDDLG